MAGKNSSRKNVAGTAADKKAVTRSSNSLTSDFPVLRQKPTTVRRKGQQAAKGSGDVFRKADSAGVGDKVAGGDQPKLGKPEKKTPLIVGIGSSAGRFEAFTQLLRRLPGYTGMAFIFVQHLDPEHESHLTDLLQHSTKMRVKEIVAGMKVEPNRVYVIPPGFDVTIESRILKLKPRQPIGDTPIDRFFESLARDLGMWVRRTKICC